MTFQLRPSRSVEGVVSLGLALAAAGCGGGSSTTPTPLPATLTVSMTTTSMVVPQDGAAVQAAVTIAGPVGTPTVTINGLPTGITGQFTAVGAGPSGAITLTGSAAAAAGSYLANVTVRLAGQVATNNFTVVSAVVVKVLNATDTTLGVSGHLQQFMSTNFQIAEWTDGFFGTGATTTARQATLNSLRSQHIRLQAISQAVPMKAHTGAATDWDFTMLDRMVQPVLASADQSPEFQIAVAPAWMCDSNGHLDIANHLNDFVDYAANLVLYYNKGGFDWGGAHFVSPSAAPITWWGIFNEPNINGLTPTQYVQLYNAVAPAMLAVDPTIKLSAIELSDWGLNTGGQGDPAQYLPPFLAGVSAPVDAFATHLYGTCNQRSTDADLFQIVPAFADNVTYFNQAIQATPAVATAQVWVNENNVNADYADVNGKSVCNPGQTWVLDPRATDAFFSAWRPYVFSQLGKAGNRALYHWEYSGGPQYDEVDSSGSTYLSYWVDKALQNFYPVASGSAGPSILGVTATDTTSIETLATKSTNGRITVMVVDHAVNAPADNNGNGAPRTVIVDTSALGGYTAASLMSIDASTNITTGPSGAGITPAARITVLLPGYGVAFFTLTP